MHAIRAFFCVELSREIRASIAEIAAGIRDALQMRASWVREPNYHITVRFLGEIDPMAVVELERVSRSVCRRIQPFELDLGTLGAFPSIDRPRVLWLGDEAAPAFRGLSTSLDVGLRAIGLPRDRKDAAAHATIARIKGRSDPSLADAVARAQPRIPLRVCVERLTLMQSELRPEGALYSALFHTALGGARADGD